MPLLLGNILKTVRKAVGWTQEELTDKLGIVRKTYSSDERTARPDRIHGSLEFYEKYKEVLGIDLYQSVNKQQIIIIDPLKLPWSKIVKLKELGAVIKMTPVFNTNLASGSISCYPDEIYTRPAFFLPAGVYPGGKFGILVGGNSLEPKICAGDHVICGARLPTENIVNGHIYFICTNEENTIAIVYADQKQQQLLLTYVNSNWPTKLITMDKVQCLYKVIGLLRKEEEINQTG